MKTEKLYYNCNKQIQILKNCAITSFFLPASHFKCYLVIALQSKLTYIWLIYLLSLVIHEFVFQGCCGAGCTPASDSLTVKGQTGANPPVICGVNTGEHSKL